ncbi:MAG: hypothetical protein CMB77_04490 [Euryarchaeota archaeon]|nr:hypothetical protein [Euryarchaeota archaeon]|tara:strand:+ start:11638 stop:12420 length:783 start_codon:yes stop_codon:yes gene_type:complete
MLTSLQIGQNGRLGNQMFQYAALASIAFTRGFKHALQKDDNVDLWKVFKMPNVDILDVNLLSDLKYRYSEPNFHFNANAFLVDDNTDMFGYFQSPIYFGNYFEIIKEKFTFKDEIRSTAITRLKEHFDDRPTCSIHVRRGDYLTKSNYHPPCSIEYYTAAKQMILSATNNKAKFLLFGDDHDWIKDNLVDDISTLIEGNTPEVDMCMMSNCSAHIISNSSFSWWAAALGNYQGVVAPKAWFGPEGPQRWDTIYIHGWGLI